MSPRRVPKGAVVGGWHRPLWATRSRTGVNCVIHDRDVPRVPQPAEGIERGQRLEVVAAVVDHFNSTANAAELVVTRSEPLVYVGGIGFTVERARSLAVLLTEVADTVESGTTPLPSADPDDQGDDDQPDEPDDSDAAAEVE